MTQTKLLKIISSISAKCPPFTHQRRNAMTAHVDQPGMTLENYGSEGFEAALTERRHWIAENCSADHLIEPMRHDGREIGRRYCFTDSYDAFAFRLRF